MERGKNFDPTVYMRDSRCVVTAKCLEVDKEYASHKGDICSFFLAAIESQ